MTKLGLYTDKTSKNRSLEDRAYETETTLGINNSAIRVNVVAFVVNGMQHQGLTFKDHHYVPPALWATGGLAVVTSKLPLSLPSPRASDPAPLISRWRTSLSLKYMNCPTGGSKSAMLNGQSCFLSGPLVKKHHKSLSEEPPRQIL